MLDPSFFPGWLRITHLVNIIFLSFLIRSGLQILSAFPRLYWTDNCRPGIEWVKFTRSHVPREDPQQLYERYVSQRENKPPESANAQARRPRNHLASVLVWCLAGMGYLGFMVVGAQSRKQGRLDGVAAPLLVSTVLAASTASALLTAPQPPPRIYTSLEEERDISPWLGLPGHKQLGLGRHWHFFTDVFWILNGLAFWVLVIIFGQWRYLVPTSWSIIPAAWQSIVAYLTFHLAPNLPGQPFDAVQKLSYFFIIFLLAPFQILTGAAMSPSISARFPWYIKLFGGRQAARSLHFLSLIVFVLFVIVHTFMVIIHGLGKELALITFGQDSNRVLAIVIAVLVLVALVGLHVAATRISLDHPRGTQRVLGSLLSRVVAVLLSREKSRQEYPRERISSYFWVNGHPPVDPAFQALADGQFAGWRLEVGGLVERQLCLSLAELRAMPKQTQITQHNCIQGWSDVAEWGGVPLRDLIALCRPLSQARYVVFHAMDDKSQTEIDPEGGGNFYGTLALSLARHPQTLLAYEMNGQPLPVPHGAPLRLRVETQLGFKMVKWVRALEFVDDYRHVGQGMGGWREDYSHYDTRAGI